MEIFERVREDFFRSSDSCQEGEDLSNAIIKSKQVTRLA